MRIFIDLNHASENNYITSASIHSNDTDIVIIAMSLFNELSELGLQKIWVSFGRVNTKVWYPIHDMTTNIGVTRSKALPFFHACTSFQLKGYTLYSNSAMYYPWIALT